VAYPPVPPIPWNLNLNRAARAHSIDKMNCTSVQPPSSDCNGTTISNRIKTYYSQLGFETDNFFNDLSTTGTWIPKHWPFYVIAGWLCDGELTSQGSLQLCATDNGGSDPNRQALMSAGAFVGYTEGSCGSTFNGFAVWTTCNFGGAATPAYSPAIYSGTHIFIQPFTLRLRFVANYYNPGHPPTTATVTVDGTPYPLSLQSGNTTAGTWWSDIFNLNATSGCQQYYFVFIWNGGSQNYPASGSLVTIYEGTCAIDYTTNGPTTTSTGVNPTTAAATSNAASTGASSASGTATSNSASSGTSSVSGTGSTGNAGSGTSSSVATGSATGSGSTSGKSSEATLLSYSLQWIIALVGIIMIRN